jgi:opacity protein-like surface antigen
MVGLLGLPTGARADGILAGFIGRSFGSDAESSTTVYGGVLGGVQPRGLGFEIDFGYWPDFFDTEDTLGIKTTITTVMGNMVIGGATARGVAPFVSGGLGLVRANLESPTDLFDNLSTNDFGINVGGGLNMMFASNFGIRGDIRYFRTFTSEDDDSGSGFPDFGIDLSDFDFWRGSVGLVVRW